MKRNRIVVSINRRAEEVFSFVLDPRNTPLWIDSIVREETNEWPARLGTVYRNQTKQGEWREYTITAYEQDRMFILSQNKGDYHVQYTVRPIGKAETELEYVEWQDVGKVDNPFTPDILHKLKTVLEQKD